VLWSRLYFISPTVVKLLWDLAAKYCWNRLPPNLTGRIRLCHKSNFIELFTQFRNIVHTYSRTLGNLRLTMDFSNLWKHCYTFTHAFFTQYKITCNSAIKKITAQNSRMPQNAFYHYLKWTFEDLLPCDCYAVTTNDETIRLPDSQPASATKEWTWLNCKRITAWGQNSEPCSCTVWVSYKQMNCQCKN